MTRLQRLTPLAGAVALLIVIARLLASGDQEWERPSWADDQRIRVWVFIARGQGGESLTVTGTEWGLTSRISPNFDAQGSPPVARASLGFPLAGVDGGAICQFSLQTIHADEADLREVASHLRSLEAGFDEATAGWKTLKEHDAALARGEVHENRLMVAVFFVPPEAGDWDSYVHMLAEGRRFRYAFPDPGLGRNKEIDAFKGALETSFPEQSELMAELWGNDNESVTIHQTLSHLAGREDGIAERCAADLPAQIHDSVLFGQFLLEREWVIATG